MYHRSSDVQRQHVLDSFDTLIFQFHALSFFLSPAIVPLLCRIASQFMFYKPRELDPRLSLRVWLLLLCLSNAPSFWSHVRDSPAQGRAVILDFVGMGQLPSRFHLVLLDALILSLQILLTTISFEVSLRSSSPSDSDPSPIPTLEIDRDDDDRKFSYNHAPTMIIDLHFRHLFNRLRNPVPLASPADASTLPLPNITPTPLSLHLRAILRQREEARRRVSEQSDSAQTANNPRSEDVGRIPGSMSMD